MGRAGNEIAGGHGINMQLLVAGGEKINKADLVALTVEGYAVQARAEEGLTAAGIAYSDADNRMGSDGDEIVIVRSGGFELEHDGKISQTDMLRTAYAKDAHTVTTSSVSSFAVGKIINVDETCATVMID